MLLASAVVVWEWLNEHGRWRPYSPAVCHHIEAVIRSDPRCASVVLGQVDSRLSLYIIDLQSMHQFRQDTGTLRPVRRSFYEPSSAPGQGCLWEWENDAGSWTAYDTEVGIAIQAARDRQQPWLDLAPLGFSYLIDFESMTQINGQTQRCRRIQRRSDLAYPMVSGPLPKSHQAWGPTSMSGPGGLVGVDVSSMGMRMNSSGNGSAYPSGALPASAITSLGQPCACQQCMMVLGVKPGTLSAMSSMSVGGMGGGYGHSLSLLGSATAALSISSSRPPPPPLPLQPLHPPISPGPSLISTVSSTCTPSPSARVLGAVSSSGVAACAAPLPPRSSLAGLSRPALQRIAMAQSRALIASGVPTVPVKNLNGSSPVHPALAGITGILMSAAGLPVCLTRPPKLVLHPPPVSKSDIKPVPGLGHCCRKTTKKQARKGKTPEEVVKRYLQKVRNPPEEDCTICMEVLCGPSGYKGPGVGGVSRAESVGRLSQCGHQYHLQCLVAMYNNGNKDGSLQCPTCKTIYGVKTGNQPPGKMEYHVIPHSLPGHPDCKTIRIIYNIPPGIQGPEHPNPGKPFTARGFPRHCYLPDSDKGRKVLRLLLVAWDRHLIFSVGTSSTTGESDTVIWNEVHHKTEFGSNLTGHGYPDPGHLDNVLEELKAQGITEEECLARD
uniref:E3 ubiquitin-protein ligase n=1 Tax=Neogobius melanostomus TaxID=47308 RepID=A0A8C6U297_9GOBI